MDFRSKRNIRSFFSALERKKDLFLIGTRPESQDTYDFLVENGIDITGFISNSQDRQRQVVLGKPVYSWSDMPDDEQSVLIECTQKHSAWGFGRADFYDYAYAEWLYTKHVPGCIVNVVRNGSVRAGSYLRFYEDQGRLPDLDIVAFWHMVDEATPRNEAYCGYDRIVVKFEDLKCKPEETLDNICHALEIRWSDTLLQTTSHGTSISYRGTSGFDIRPVYKTYEKYFLVMTGCGSCCYYLNGSLSMDIQVWMF